MQMNPPAKEEIQVGFLGQEDQLEKLVTLNVDNTLIIR